MKKTLAAVAAGALLIAAQSAIAQSAAASPRVGDRLGAPTGEASEFGGVPIFGVIAAAGVLVAALSVAGAFDDDDSESD